MVQQYWNCFHLSSGLQIHNLKQIHQKICTTTIVQWLGAEQTSISDLAHADVIYGISISRFVLEKCESQIKTLANCTL